MNNIQFWGVTLRLLVGLAGTAAFALSGVLAAAGSVWACVGVTAGLRAFALWRNWQLPARWV